MGSQVTQGCGCGARKLCSGKKLSLDTRLGLGEEGRGCQATYHDDVLVFLSGQVCILKNWVEKEEKHNQQKWPFDPKDPQYCRLFPVLSTLSLNHVQ